MAITWSAGSGASNPHYVGIETFVYGTTIVVDRWVKATYSVGDSQTLHRTVNGSSVGDVGYYLSEPAAVKVNTRSFTGTPGQTYWVGASLSGVYNGGSPSVSRQVSVPVNPPAAPTDVTATRISDSQYVLNWTRHATSTAPYTRMRVERSVDGGNYAIIATISGGASSYLTGTAADHSYKYRVRAYNPSGWSDVAYTSHTYYTTPAAPVIDSAVKVGADIVLTFSHTARYPTGARVYASQDGGAYAFLGTVGTASGTYPHESPSAAVTWAYKVTATVGGLESGMSAASQTVQLLVAPLAPTLLGPSGAVDATEPVVLVWQHNPVDTTGQTEHQVWWRESGGAWSAPITTGAVNIGGHEWELELPAGTLTNGRTIEWKAQTKGDHVDWSPESTLGAFSTSARPTVLHALPDLTITTSSLTFPWAYYDAEGTAQSQWRATLTDGTTTETRSGQGATDTVTFQTPLPDGSSWDVTIVVRDGVGVWSLPDTASITVDYAPPPTPVVEADYDPLLGSVALTVTNPDPVSPEVLTDHNDLFRSLDEGASWVLIGQGLPLGGTMVDPLPRVGGRTLYRAVAVSETPSSAVSATVVVDTTDTHGGWCFASWGPGFSESVRLRAGVQVTASTSRSKELVTFSAEESPVEFLRSARPHGLSVSARLAPCDPGEESQWPAVESLASAPAPICWRDPTGRRVFVSVGPVGVTAEGLVQSATVALTRVRHVE